MLDTVETIARTIGRSKTMLTVFTTNHRAIALYKKKGYTVDAASPPDRVLKSGIKKAPYKIMSMDWGNDDEEATDEEGELMQLSD
jgi:ribosomal protein S18 acetylase RimI-like enzyme